MRRYLIVLTAVIFMLAMLTSCNKQENTLDEGETSLQVNSDKSDTTLTKPAPELSAETEAVSVDLLYEAEDAALEGLRVYTDNNGPQAKSGSGYVGLWDSEESKLTFHVEVPEDGVYELAFITAAVSDGESYNTVAVNDRTFYEGLYTKGKDFSSSSMKAKLNKGTNVVSITIGWGWIYVDCMHVRLAEGIDADVYNVDKTLSNKNASKNTQRLMSYMVDQYGKYTLSGQYNNDKGINSPEVQELHKLTSKYPAIMGFDFVDYSPSRVEHGTDSKQTEYAVQWHDMGGIITFMWHWNAPKGLLNTDEQPWWRGFYTEATTFDLNRALNGDDPVGYDLIIRNIDVIAEQLKILADKDIPVLWRPLHEASGGWFWWGAYGADNYKKLWKLMYQRLTDTHGLNNLIWIYSAQDADWYPGDEYVDIIGEDVYSVPYDYESHYNLFGKALGYTNTKRIVGLAEIGEIPDPDLMYEDNACWSFFIIWNDEYVVDKKSKKISDQFNELDHFVDVFNHEKIITLDELPDLVLYPID